MILACAVKRMKNSVVQYEEEMERFKKRILEDDAFAEKFGELGPVYGKQWRAWETTQGEPIDQLKNLVHQIKTNPNSRRLILSSWSPEFTPQMALPPCHTLFQFYVHDGKLSLSTLSALNVSAFKE